MLCQTKIMKILEDQNFEFIPYLPTLKASESQPCVSFMFYDSEKAFSHEWIEWLERFFVQFSLSPDSLILHQDGKTRAGKYKRQKGALFKAVEKNGIDFQIRSKIIDSSIGFFPSEISVSVNTSGLGKMQGVFSVRKYLVPNLLEFSKSLALELLPLVGDFYGHSSRFPIILGPDAYGAGLGTIPKGWSFASTKSYTGRLTTWRKRSQHLESIKNYFREIFPINFLKDSHMHGSIFGKPARLFYEDFGTIMELANDSKQFVWVVETDKIELLRKSMEEEGLILSHPKKGQICCST